MLKRIQITNYRSCVSTEFDLQPDLSVLIGPNASGKTNVLNAIRLLDSLASEDGMVPRRMKQQAGESTLKAWFELDGRMATLTARISIYTDERNRDVIVASNQEWYVWDFTRSRKRLKVPLAFLKSFREEDGEPIVTVGGTRVYLNFGDLWAPHKLPRQVRKPLQEIAGYVSDMKYYSASQFTNPATCPVSFEIEEEGPRRRGLRLRGHARFLYDLYTEYQKQDEEGYQQFFDIIGPDGIGLVDKLEFKEIQTSSIDYSVQAGGDIEKRTRTRILVVPQFTIGNHTLSPNQLSEGTFKAITLLFYLMTQSSSILLIEEPEVCVHHGLLASILELIKDFSSEKQIIVSTHSDFVLDRVTPSNVYKVENDPSRGTVVTHVPKSMPRPELMALREYLEQEGNLGEYWRHGRLDP